MLREDGFTHPADPSRSNLGTALRLLSSGVPNPNPDLHIVLTSTQVDAQGSVVWCESFGGDEADNGLALAVGETTDAATNTTTDVLYVGGTFRGTATFGSRTLTAATADATDGFVLKVRQRC